MHDAYIHLYMLVSVIAIVHQAGVELPPKIKQMLNSFLRICAAYRVLFLSSDHRLSMRSKLRLNKTRPLNLDGCVKLVKVVKAYSTPKWRYAVSII